MEYEKKAKELIYKFNNLYPNIDWTNIAINSINEILKNNTNIEFINYWNNIKIYISNRNIK
jgi:hypothetical protein